MPQVWRSWLRSCLLALVCLVLPKPAAASCPPIGLGEFHRLVDAYRAGDPSALEEFDDCSPKTVSDIARGLGTKADRTPWDAASACAAAMLATDAVVRSRFVHPSVSDKVNLASRVLELGGPGAAPFASMWYEAMARWLRINTGPLDAEELLKHGRERLPGDARVLYESGVTAELFAMAYQRETPLVGGSASFVRRNGGNTMADAVSYFRGVLAMDPYFDLAKVRLAHVLLLQGDTAGIPPLTDFVFAHSTEAPIGYLANLVGGAALEREGRFDEAALRYRLALMRFGEGQYAHIALSEVLQRAGRPAEARAAIDAFLSSHTTATVTREPWWALMLDGPASVDALLATLRAAARR